MTKFLLVGWFLIIVTSQKAQAQEFRISIGVIFEENTEVERRALRIAAKHVNNDDDVLSSAIELDFVFRNQTEGDVYKATKNVCNIARIGVAALITMTSCPVEIALQSMSDAFHLPIMQIGSGYCGFPRLSGNFFFTSRPDEEIILRALVQYIEANKIRTIVICYEDGTDTTNIQRLFSTLTRRKRYDIESSLMKIPTAIESDLVDNSGVIRMLMTIVKSNHEKSIDALLIFARPSVTVQFIAKAHRADPGESFHQKWIITNPDIRMEHLKEIESATSSSVVVIKHSINKDNVIIQKLVAAWNNELTAECPKCSPKNVGAEDIPISAYYLYDGVRHLSQALSDLLNDNWKSPTPLRCQALSVTPWSGGRNLMSKIKETNSTGMLGKMLLNNRGYQRFATYDFLMKLSGTDEEFQKGTTWDSEALDSASELIPVIEAKNKTFRVATVEEPPFVIVDRKPDGQVSYKGFSIDLMYALAERNQFKFDLYEVADRKYGTMLPDGSWNGLVGDIMKGNADLAIAAMTITAQREKVIDFTKRYMDYSVGIVMKKTQQTATLFSFIYPFHPSVWFCILSALLLVVVLIFVLNQVSPLRLRTDKCQNDNTSFTIVNCFWFVYSSLMQQGGELKTVTLPVRLVTGFWWFFALIVVSSYTANLAAFLTVTRMETPIRNFNDLANQKSLQYGTVQDTSIFDHIMSKGNSATDENSLYYKMARQMNHTENRLTEAREGFQRAESGTYAFLWDVAVIEYEVINSKTCDLTTVADSIYDKGYGIALERGSPFRDVISLGILALQDSGVIEKLVSKWWPKGKCSLDHYDSASRGTELSLQNFAGVFCVLAAGLVIACVMAGLEIILHIKKGRPYPPVDNAQNDGEEEHDGHNLTRVQSIESQASEEEILVVLKKKDVMRYLAESDKRSSTLTSGHIPSSRPHSWNGKSDELNGKNGNQSVVGSLCCHRTDSTKMQKIPQDEDRVELSSEQLQRTSAKLQPRKFNDTIRTAPDKGPTCTLVRQRSNTFHKSRNNNIHYDFTKLSMPNLTSQYEADFSQKPTNSVEISIDHSQFSALALRRRLLRHKHEIESSMTSPSSCDEPQGNEIMITNQTDSNKRKKIMTSQMSYTLPLFRPTNGTSLISDDDVSRSRIGLSRSMTSSRNMASQTRNRRHPRNYATWRALYSSSSQERTDAEGSIDLPAPMTLVFNHKREPENQKSSRLSLFKNSCV